MQMREINGTRVTAISFGCMNLSHGYGPPRDLRVAQKVLHRALDTGYSMLDTAALYGFGANEELIGATLKPRRNEYFLASKCGLFKNSAGQREVNGRPEIIKQTCEDSLRRLRTDFIDLYYLHRMDRKVPIEDSVGALSDLVAEGKIGCIGLSEISAATLEKAHAVHPVSALQNEYSLMSRNPEIASLELCRRLGVTLVAFSPLGRGLLTDVTPDPDSMPASDIRHLMPRFQGNDYGRNLALLEKFGAIANRAGCTRAQLALLWLLNRGEHVMAIPGTTSEAHLQENFAALELTVDPDILQEVDGLINQHTVSGERYPQDAMAEIDSENFDPGQA